jgi:hypothetical protein
MEKAERVTFPFVPINEWNVLRTYTAPGLFAYRHIQALDLLHFPDFGDGDMTKEQRREALDYHINFYKPLTAVVIFLNVVALEDFIRDIGIRISNVENIEQIFPKISELKMKPQKPNSDKPSKQLDKDPVPLMDFEKLNDNYYSSIGVKPINKKDFARLYDLTIIRHCIAHNGSIVREIDLPRFQYYNITSNQIINPPAAFVKETCGFLYNIGKDFENSIRHAVFSKVLKNLDSDWELSKPKILTDLIELFNFFGKIPSGENAFSRDPKIRHKNNEEKYQQLIELCIKELTATT